MGLLTKIFGGADGCREAMHESYAKHVQVARQGKAGVANIDDAHYVGLYGALGSRYRVRGHAVSEAEIMAELAPFCAMGNEQQAIEALAEYVLYQEGRSEARIEWLSWCINSALQACKEEHWLGLAAMGLINRVKWCDLLNPEMRNVLERVNSFADQNYDEQKLPSSSGTETHLKDLAHHQGDADASARASLSAQPSLALAEQGDAEAQFYLGGFYRMGLGMPQNLERAAYWSRKAAEQGHVKAQSDMGFIYTYGSGVPQDYMQAMMWYLIAKAGGANLADQDWKELEALSTPAQIAEAQRGAREWWTAHHPTN